MSEDRNSGNTTDYTNVTFDEIRSDLVNRAKTKYPDTYRDFSESSFGALMFDLMSMMGEQLNFYAHFVANECHVNTARGQDSLDQLAMNDGWILGAQPVIYGFIDILAAYPIDALGNPDPDAAFEIEAESLFTGAEGQIAELCESAYFHPNTMEIQTSQYSVDGSTSAMKLGKVTKLAKLGKRRSFSVTVGKQETPHFSKILIADQSFSEIISCIDARGEEYYQVPNLLIDTIEVEAKPRSAQEYSQGMSTYTTRQVPRRFQIIKENGKFYMLFGKGSENQLTVGQSNSDIPAEPTAGVIQSRGNLSSEEVDTIPEMFSDSESFGIAPQDTVLTITYRSNDGVNVGAAAGTINTVSSAIVEFDKNTLTDDVMSEIKNSITCNNPEPFTGHVSYGSTQEIAQILRASRGSQGRAVTFRDLKAQIYRMPTKYGKVKKVNVTQNLNGLRKKINIYLASESSDGSLAPAGDALRSNVRTYLNRVKMIHDQYDIFDAQILNLGIELDLKLSRMADRNTALSVIKEKLFEKIQLDPPTIGDSFSIGRIIRKLNEITSPKIDNVSKIKIVVKNGEGYSDTFWDIPGNMLPDGSEIYLPENYIWEIKNIQDITGKIF